MCEEAVMFEDPTVASKKIEIGENDSCSVFFINLFFAWAGKKHSTTQHPSIGVLFVRQLYKIRSLVFGMNWFNPSKSIILAKDVKHQLLPSDLDLFPKWRSCFSALRRSQKMGPNEVTT